ncbi:MAG: argininosuccinate lyase, partial [Planctomycetota bacterium]
PDTLELTRGKSARVMGNLQTLMLLVKNLPLAYNRDLQEDKPPLFDSFDTVTAMLELAVPIVAESELRREAIAARIEEGYLDATTLMEWLIKKEVPQRTAHHAVGAIVGEAMQRGVTLSELPIETMRTHAPAIDESIREVLGTKNAVNAFTSFGSTAPSRVRAQIERWSARLAT